MTEKVKPQGVRPAKILAKAFKIEAKKGKKSAGAEA